MATAALQTYQTNPIRNQVFFAIPRTLALRSDISDRLFRLMSILYSAFGDDGHIEYKLATLSKLLNKSIRSTKEVVKEAVRKGLIIIKSTGRSLVFKLVENPPIREAETRTSEVRKSALPIPYIKEREKRKLDPPPEPPQKQLPEPPVAKSNPATADCLKKLRNKIPASVNPNISNTFLAIGIDKNGFDYMSWLADECGDKPNPVKYFCKGVHHREEFNKYDRKTVREGEAKAVREHERHKLDLKALIECIGKRLVDKNPKYNR
jgi:hypothetical protein